MSEILLETRGLKKYFKTPAGMLHAVDGIDCKIKKGDTLGVVGESGCGKSTLGKVVVDLIPASDGQILYSGADIRKAKKSEKKKSRHMMQMIFQDPSSSLNPRMTVMELIAEPMLVTPDMGTKKEIYAHAYDLMDKVGLAKRLASAYPHELDGGRRQRIGVARAIAPNPQFIVCDEPVSALDVSVQAQILNLLMDLHDELGLTYMFITHDLSVVRHISDEIMVMYLGQCVEYAPADLLFKNPCHPYTKALISVIPKPNLQARSILGKTIQGELSNPINPKPGCRFASRCPHCSDECTTGDVALKAVEAGHYVACTKV